MPLGRVRPPVFWRYQSDGTGDLLPGYLRPTVLAPGWILGRLALQATPLYTICPSARVAVFPPRFVLV